MAHAGSFVKDKNTFDKINEVIPEGEMLVTFIESAFINKISRGCSKLH